MSRPGKPMAKNSNSKFTTRNNKQDIFSKLTKASELKADIKIQSTNVHKENSEQTNS